MSIGCPDCSSVMVRINGRTWNEAVRRNIGSIGKRRRPVNEWVRVCPACQVDILSSSDLEFPFLCADGVMRTCSDIADVATSAQELDLAGFRFTLRALHAALGLQRKEATKSVDKISAIRSATTSLEFSKAVCMWGGGGRVWTRIEQLNHNKADLKVRLDQWLAVADSSSNYFEAIAPGYEIPGLGVSFASKHLRWLKPDRYAVLDDVLEEGLGFAANPVGYRFFMNTLREFQSKNVPPIDQSVTVAELESAIFLLVRQTVRSNANAKRGTKKA
jgi:hypothetical protein